MNNQVDEHIALASYPRSGNTWVRFLLEKATGQRSSSVYNCGGKIMPRSNVGGIVTKTHIADYTLYDRAIYLIRNPFDAFESFYHWHRDIEGNAGLEWHKHIQGCILTWFGHTQHWVRARPCIPVYTMRYEDLHADTLGELKALLGWLGWDVPNENIVAAVEASDINKLRKAFKYGPAFFRRGTIGEGINAFSTEEQYMVINALADFMIFHGYESTIRGIMAGSKT